MELITRSFVYLRKGKMKFEQNIENNTIEIEGSCTLSQLMDTIHALPGVNGSTKIRTNDKIVYKEDEEIWRIGKTIYPFNYVETR